MKVKSSEEAVDDAAEASDDADAADAEDASDADDAADAEDDSDADDASDAEDTADDAAADSDFADEAAVVGAGLEPHPVMQTAVISAAMIIAVIFFMISTLLQ